MTKSHTLNASEATAPPAPRTDTKQKSTLPRGGRRDRRYGNLALREALSLLLAVLEDDPRWTLPPARNAVAAAVRPRGRPPVTYIVPGSSSARLLALLDRPRHRAELPALLGVTRERVRQLIGNLVARDLIRLCDGRSPGFVLALKDDPSLLLPQDQESVLSAFPETAATTLAKIAVATSRAKGQVATAAASLRDAGLIEETGATAHASLYRLTAAGSAHWQRCASVPRADEPPLPFRSNRVHDVLSYLASEGPARARDVGRRLDIPYTSINALMQYLKQRGMLRVQSDARHAPHELTPGGRDMLAAMRRNAGNAGGA